MTPKNILFVVTDDQRYDTIAALGNADIKTPTLDLLTEEGIALTGAHIPCGTCGAVCMPSRAMLFSGRTLFHLEGNGENIPPEHITLPQHLQENGYECFATGKWHNGTPAFARSFTGGDNLFFGGMWDHWNVPTCRHDPTGQYDNVINFVANFWHNSTPWRIHCDRFHPGVHSSELLTDTALTFLKERKTEKPFFLSLTYLAPHDPRTMPQAYKDMYDPTKITLPKNCMKSHPFSFGVESIRDETLAAYPRDEKEIRTHLAEYYGMISHLDHELGRIVTLLKAQGIWEDTLIVFTGDNGLAVGSHGLMGKQSNYDHSVRVPLLLCGPGIPKGRRSETYLYLLDIYPTLCEYLGLPIPASVEGKSFLPALTQPSYCHRDSLFFAYGDLVRSVKDAQYKLIEYRGGAQETQLFDLKADPAELQNLSADIRYRETIFKMRQLLEEYRATWEDTNHPATQSYWTAYDSRKM